MCARFRTLPLKAMLDEYWSAWIAAEARAEHRRGDRGADAARADDADQVDQDKPDGMMDEVARGATAERLAVSDAQRDRIQARLVEQLFNEEVRRAYERVIQPLRQKMERVYQVTEPSPEQREAIRAALIDYIRDGRLRPNEEQRRRLVERIYEVLNEDQRLKLFEAALSQM